MNLEKRVLLCIPHGGLNDTLCQIEKCRDYAEKYNRTLYIDTRKSGLLSNFSDFFQMKNTANVSLVGKIGKVEVEELNRLSTRPVILQGKVGSFQLEYSTELQNLCEKDSGIPVTFNFEIDHKEHLLIHAQFGGGSLSYRLLNNLYLSEVVRVKILENLSMLPNNYIGIHVRNTDYKTDYRSFFQSIAKNVSHANLFVCSDDAYVIQQARLFFKSSNIIEIDAIPNNNNGPLHHPNPSQNDLERRNITTKALTDLICLANADELYYANVSHGFPSGFSRLARYMHENKHLINSLLQFDFVHLDYALTKARLIAIERSVSWRIIMELQRIIVNYPSFCKLIRRTAKFVWWALTFQLLAKLSDRTEEVILKVIKKFH